jgi:hypothetical protein
MSTLASRSATAGSSASTTFTSRPPWSSPGRDRLDTELAAWVGILQTSPGREQRNFRHPDPVGKWFGAFGSYWVGRTRLGDAVEADGYYLFGKICDHGGPQPDTARLVRLLQKRQSQPTLFRRRLLDCGGSSTAFGGVANPVKPPFRRTSARHKIAGEEPQQSKACGAPAGGSLGVVDSTALVVREKMRAQSPPLIEPKYFPNHRPNTKDSRRRIRKSEFSWPKNESARSEYNSRRWISTLASPPQAWARVSMRGIRFTLSPPTRHTATSGALVAVSPLRFVEPLDAEVTIGS